jgi:triosephosphate isomerase
MTPALLVAVSLKAYFGYAETREWLRQFAALLDDWPASADVELAVFPPAPLLEYAVHTVGRNGAGVGAQDVSRTEAGPFTGETTASLLAEMGCRYAEVGHSERRRWFGEDDEVVADKADAAARQGLIPLICVGEYDRHVGAGTEVVRQARYVVDRLAGRAFVLAYEPVWAIGATEPADPDWALRIGDQLRRSVPEFDQTGRLIYGGTAGPGTLSDLVPGFDGVFLGRRAHRIEGLRQVLAETRTITGLERI